MEKDELEKKIEVERQKELLRRSRPSWLIFMAREDSRRKPVTDLNRSSTPPKLRHDSEENKFWHDDGP